MSGERTVMIIEDDQAVSDLYKTVLQSAGVSSDMYKEFKSAEEAQTYLDNNTNSIPALMIINFKLPGEDGLLFMRKIRSSMKPYKNIHAVLVTANSSVWGHELAITEDLGLSRIISKPFDPNELKNVVLAEFGASTNGKS